jgi:hypothetical protein
LTLTDVRRGIEVSAGLLTRLELDGIRYHVAPQTLSAAPPTSHLYLLPGFDEYLLGYADRTAALSPSRADAVVPGGNGMFKPTVVVDGVVVGTWRRTVTAREVVVEPLLWHPLPRGLRVALCEAADAYGAFLGRSARLA